MIRHLRNTRDDFGYIFTHGGCYQLYLMIKAIYPEAEAYYSHSEGHVYTWLGEFFVDITGEILPPNDVVKMDANLHRRARDWRVNGEATRM